MLTVLTSYNSVRAVLGVTARILPDATLEDETFELVLIDDLAVIGSLVDPVEDIYEDYQDAIGITTSDRDARTFVNSLRLFSAHSIALACAKALPELSPVLISDSKATQKKDKAGALGLLQADYSKYRRRLIEAYAAYLGVNPPVSAPPTVMGVSSPVFDPVVGA